MKIKLTGIAGVAVLITVIAYQQYQIQSLQANLADLQLANHSLQTAVQSQNLVLDFLIQSKELAEQDVAILVARQVATNSLNQAKETDILIRARQQKSLEMQAQLAKSISKLLEQ